MKYFYPIHFDGGNRGCEAIARSTAQLVGLEPADQIAYCRDVELDKRLGLARYLTLMPAHLDSYLADRCLAALCKFFPSGRTFAWRKNYPYRSLLRLIAPGDRVLFTGGDMLCYGNNEIITLNDELHRRGVATILWGCSMGPENLTPEKRRTLDHFSLIYARESLTCEFFQSLGLRNIVLLPDPAFVLLPEPCQLPSCFDSAEVIGINISSYVMGGVGLQSPFAREVLGLLEHILSHTALHILLVPHVTWVRADENQDDRQMGRLILQHFGNNPRISQLEIDSLNYSQIRHVISRCCAFIGARTHSVISAYSTCVPAIALGYSIKSRGIARDLGLDTRLVVNSKDFREGDLLRAFCYLDDNHEAIRQHLASVIPDYCRRPLEITQILQTAQF